MKRTLAVALLWPSLVLAQNPLTQPNSELRIQTDELITWQCDYDLTLSSIVSVTVTQLQGATDSSPASLVTGEVVANCADGGTNQCAEWQFVGTGRGGTYQVHVLAETSGGDRFACDGKVIVEDVTLPS